MGEDQCNIGLGLGIGGGDYVSRRRVVDRERDRKVPVQFHVLFPPRMKEEDDDEEEEQEEDHANKLRFKNNHGPEIAIGKDDTGGGGGSDYREGARKKLRLSKEQSALLEDSFRAHNTLNPTQKQELAHRLNLRPRQVEVWFQNRRARTKLKQTEVDCEFLKKCCESLSDENRRLKRELQELRSAEPPQPLYLHRHPKAAATLAMCPSCERTIKDSSMAC